MSIRNLEHVFRPESIALVGASEGSRSVGAVLAQNLVDGGFAGALMFVNPAREQVLGRDCHRDVADLPETPDLAVVCTPPRTVPGIVDVLARRGTRGVVVISAGFAESTDPRGRELQQSMLDAARPALLRLVGPNCLGILVPTIGLNASFAHLAPPVGHLAFVTQSGAIVTSVLDWAEPRGIGFSHLVSLGGMADVDFGDMLDYLANDRDTHAILLYVEAVTNARKFMSAARAASRMKPVLVVKAGRHAESARAAASHTGALAGSDDVYDAVFQRAGMLRVHDLDDLFDAVEVLATGRRPAGNRLAILTNGGGMGVLATDALMDHDGELAELSAETMTALDRSLPPTWSHGNPVDIIGDAGPERYAAALDALSRDRGVDAILAINCPTAVASSADAARAVIEHVARRGLPPVLTSWVGDHVGREARALLSGARIPSYETPGEAVRGFMYLVDHARRQATLMETPPSVPEVHIPDVGRARAIIADGISAGLEWLSERDSKALLSAYGIPVVATERAAGPDEAAAIAARLGGRVALKILSPDITHKSDVGGVALELAGPGAVRAAARAMLEKVAAARADARIEGFTVAPMVHRPGAHELIVGITTDAQFGPVVLFGQGGTAAELLADTSLALPPLNMRLAKELVGRTRIGRLLGGYRDRPAANVDAVALSLIRTAQLAMDHAAVVELDINPLLADDYGVIALDARVRIERTDAAPSDRLCIRPYPSELEEDLTLANGRSIFLRPILPEDEVTHRAWFQTLDPEDVRMRFFVPKKTLSHVQSARFTQIDYDREMALVVTERGIPGRAPIHGVVRISADPDNESAEYAIIISRELAGVGLGRLLMERIIDYARRRGIGEIFGEVLKENTRMLRLCEALGFTREPVPGEPEIVRVSLRLRG
ncbi:MAG: bifunctional acetate--CoA ligase family protein/GNAT family N-acetyltransferase [Gammaproteobacteria bacterium]|nr:bifunctional acetate--CoA ligase family protein/GNAT family N-acetyltransferase [Gammaproteobacteria bacterium]